VQRRGCDNLYSFHRAPGLLEKLRKASVSGKTNTQ
jgi:hypothetical protein